MNQKLTEEIAYHVIANLGALPSSFVDQDQTRSLLNKEFLLLQKLTFETADGETLRRNVYGCQIAVTSSKELKLLIADCSQEKDIPEFCLLIQLKDAPAFGVYFLIDQTLDFPEKEALIAVNTDKKHWIPCTTYLQATFLAGMEQLRDMNFGWGKCQAHQELYEQLLSFIKFHNTYYGVTDEREEN